MRAEMHARRERARLELEANLREGVSSRGGEVREEVCGAALRLVKRQTEPDT